MEGPQRLFVWMQRGKYKLFSWLIQQMICSQLSWMQIRVKGLQVKDSQTWRCSLCPWVFCLLNEVMGLNQSSPVGQVGSNGPLNLKIQKKNEW